jgi:cytochrome c
MTARRLGSMSLAILLLFAQGAVAADESDPLFVKGRSLFNRCRACHAFKPDTRSLSRGPNLWGVIGRKAGSLANYTEYSQSMLESKIVWDTDAIDKYLANPKGYIPGNLMNFIGVPKPEERKAIVAYLARVAAEAPPPAQTTGLKLVRVDD